MQKRPEFSEILAMVKTKADLEQLLEEIGWLKESLYRTEKGFEETLEKRGREGVAEAIKQTLPEGKEEREKFLQGLEEAIRVLPVVTLKLAIEPSQELVEKISGWLEQNVGRVVMELTTDPALVAGAEISFQGRYSDGSLRKELKAFANMI